MWPGARAGLPGTAVLRAAGGAGGPARADVERAHRDARRAARARLTIAVHVAVAGDGCSRAATARWGCLAASAPVGVPAAVIAPGCQTSRDHAGPGVGDLLAPPGGDRRPAHTPAPRSLRPVRRLTGDARDRARRSAQGRAASSCAASASSAPSPSGWPMSCTPTGRPARRRGSSGTLIAGEPVRFETGVNGVKSPGAREAAPSGRPRRTCRSSPSGSGGSASAGHEHRVVAARSTRRSRARRACSCISAVETLQRVDALARAWYIASDSGSMSSSVGSRPATCAPNAVCVEIIGAHSVSNCSSSPGTRHGGSASIDLVAEVGQQRRGLLDGARASRVDGRGLERRRASSSRSAGGPGSRRGLRGERLGRRRRPGHVAELGPAITSSATRGLLRRARHDAVDAEERLADAAAPSEIRPRCGFSPTSPQQAAGMRVEPPPSLAWAIGTMPGGDRRGRAAATSRRACARGPTGCASAPKRRGSVVGDDPELGQVRRADDDRAGLPQPRRRATASIGGAKSPKSDDANVSALAGDRAVVLDRDRHAGERPLVARRDRRRRRRSASSWKTSMKAL